MKYYVKNDGDNGNTGLSDDQAWETIKYVNSQNFANNDTIHLKRGSTFTDATLTLDGTPAGRSEITVQDYGTGDKPWIDGNSVQPIYINHALVNLAIKNIDVGGLGVYATRCQIVNVNGVVVDGVDCNGHSGVGTRFRCNAITMAYVNGDIEIKNCTIQNLIKDTWEDTISSWGDLDAHGILFWYPADAKKSGIVSVHNNIIHDVYADCIQTACVQTTTNIYNNQLYNFGENAVDHKKGRYIDIYRNSISSGGVKDGRGTSIGGGAGASYCTDCVAQDITVRDNYFYDTPGIGVAISAFDMNNYNVYRNYFKNVGLGVKVSICSNSNVYNNIFELNDPIDSSFVGTDRSAIRVTYNQQSNVKIYNNTIYISSSNHLYGIAVQADADATGTIIKNNIIHMARNNAGVFPLYIGDYDNSGTFPTVQYNNLYGVHSNRVKIEETPGNWVTYDATEQAAWRTAGHTGGLFTDPKFVNPSVGDLTLQSSSPAINAGADLGAIYKMALGPASIWPNNVVTLDQYLHGDGWEIGAYVYAAYAAKGQIVGLTYPASVDHGAMCDINAAIKNIGELSGRFKTQILINSILLATSAEFTLAGGATSTDKIDPFMAPLSGENMDIIIKCIRSV